MRDMKKGFTLVEVLIVIVIISTLAAMIVPHMTSQIARAKLAQPMQLFGIMRRNLANYASTHGYYPPSGAATWFPAYTDSGGIDHASSSSGNFLVLGVSNYDVQQIKNFNFNFSSTTSSSSISFSTAGSYDPSTYASVGAGSVFSSGNIVTTYMCSGLVTYSSSANPCDLS